MRATHAFRAREAIRSKKVEEAIYNELGVESGVELVPKGSIGRVLFKAQRVITTYK